MKYRVGIVTNKGRIESKNFATRNEVDDYILSFDKEELITHYRIVDRETKQVIETEQGVKQ